MTEEQQPHRQMTPGQAAPSQAAPRRSSWVPVTTAIIGGVVILGASGSAALAGLAVYTQPWNAEPQRITADASEIEELEVRVSRADASITCNVESSSEAPGTALLEASGGPQRWNMVVEDGTLRVEPERGPFGWFAGFSSFMRGDGSGQTVTLSLPAEFCSTDASLDADFEVSGGQLKVFGVYGEIDAEVSGGDFRIEGRAETAKVQVSAGDVRLDLMELREAELEVSAGSITGDLQHASPGNELDLRVSAGEIDLLLPNWPYLVDADVSAGELDNRLMPAGLGEKNRIDVRVSAGSVILRPAS